MNRLHSEKPFLPRAALLIPSLLPAAAMLVWFHLGNRFILPAGGAFLQVPFRFLTQLDRFRTTLPEGLLSGCFWSLAALSIPWWFGWNLLKHTVPSRLLRVLVAFPIGLGILGVGLEGLAMAGWFHRLPVVCLYLVLGVLGFFLGIRRTSKETGRDTQPLEPCHPAFRVPAWMLFLGMTVLVFEHALFFPPTYHDALIYYLYYAKLIFLNGGIPFPVDANGFPELVQCQVGLGLGANYPHLFLLWQASVGSAADKWSPVPGQLLPPVAGTAVALLVYAILRERWRKECPALWGLLLTQSAPYWIWYQSWVSDYPLAVWLTVAAVALSAVTKGSHLRLLTGLAALAIAGSHLNYLMVSLWLFPLVFWLRMGTGRFRRAILAVLGLGMLLSSTWFIRNWVVTGNPVYAFFPEIFGGKNIDMNVLRSCEVEWNANGDGFNQVGGTFAQRLAGLFRYFVLDPALHIKWGVLPAGWFLPGLMAAFFLVRKEPWLVVVLAYIGFFFFYGLAISGMYLYHLMPVVPLMVLVAGAWMKYLAEEAVSRRIHSVLVFVTVFTIGFPAAVYGPKSIGGTLDHTLHPGRDPEAFLERVFPDYYRMWSFINRTLPEGSIILTHENRHYYLRDDLKFLHLDDYRLIDLYGHPPEEVTRRLKELGVDYYLQIPNENNHPILKELGIDNLIGSALEYVAGPRERNLALYRFVAAGGSGGCKGDG